ncbi:MAG TPA: glycosyl hydrolase family 28-related protein [Lacunisphaera sp.]|nr:glycosyl hydrolase family 28-related protein [Lacunisphaera sp.]
MPNAAPRARFDVRRFGAAGDGRTLDTAALNRAIAAAAAAGGGEVLVPAGDYLCHSLRLRSHITLRLAAGATLIAADPPPAGDPAAPGYDPPEEAPANFHQDFGHSHFHNSLVWGVGLEQVAVLGPGRIYGRGLSRGNGRIALPVGQVAAQPPGHLPDVLEADGPVEPAVTPAAPGAFGYPSPTDTLPAGVGNKAIALKSCRGVDIRDLTILHGGHFAILAADCEHVTVERVVIDTNRDGIDIDACAHVRIEHCTVNSPWDDGICVKSSCGFGGVRPAEHITIAHCHVSGFEEGTLVDGTRSRVIRHRGGPIGRIKLGTEASGGFRQVVIRDCEFEFCRGLALEQVDGAIMEDITVANLVMREVMNAPIFIRLGGRLRAPGATQPGTARRIAISHVTAHDVAPDHGIFIAGVPGHPVTDVELAAIDLRCRGGGTPAAGPVPELVDGYPEPMLFGPLPAWGLYVRHAAGLQLREISLRLLNPDPRAAVVLDDVADVDASGVRLTGAGPGPQWELAGATGLRARNCDGMGT